MPTRRSSTRPWTPRLAALPRFDSLAPALATLDGLRDFPSVVALDAALAPLLPRRPDGGSRYRLVTQVPAPTRGPRRVPSERYDVVIDARGEIPTREESWHDLFNALVWASFPRAKARLSARQRRLHDARGPAVGPRTRAQDALALLDEGAVLVLCDAADRDALTADLLASPPEALWAMASAGRVREMLFGHALFEHAVYREAVRAAVTLLPVTSLPDGLDAARALADAALAARLDDDDDLRVPAPFAAAPIAQPGD